MNEFAAHVLISLKNNAVYVYMFIFAAAFLESFAFLGLIAPGAAIVVTAGILAYKGYLNIYWLMGLAVFGAILADIVSFIIGEKYSKYVIKTKLYAKYKNYFDKGENFFKKHGGKSVFLGRFIGFLRPVIPFIAGALKMNRYIFFIWAVISGVLWGIVYIGFGYYSAKGFNLLNNSDRNINYATVAIIAAAIITYTLKKYIEKKR